MDRVVTADPPAGLTEAAQAALAGRMDAATTRLAPGWLAAVTWRGEVLAIATGGSPRHDGRPTAPDTVFRIASMSKSFLAATALALRDEGMLDFHAPATEYVPALRSARFEGRPVDLTLDELLSNRGGLAEDNPWGDEHLGASREEIGAEVAAGLRLSASPGTEYQYSNLGISLVGRAIEAVTGRAVEEEVRDRILAPLGLHDTRAAAELYPEGTDLAQGFRTFDGGETFAFEPYVGSGALACIGSLFSTAADIATWTHFLGSAFGADAVADGVLAERTRREMQTARTLIPLGADGFPGRTLDGAGYGYGLVVEHDRRFGRVLQHAGGLPGFSSHMRWQVASGLGVVVFGNSDAFGAGRIAVDIHQALLGAVDAPAAVVRPWPEVVDAARRLDHVVRCGGSLADVGRLLARNVLRDVPLEVRERRVAEALAEVGPPVASPPRFEDRVRSASDASALRWTIPCERGTLVCDVQAIGLAAPLVQAFSVRVAGPDGRTPTEDGEQVDDRQIVAAL